MIALDLFAGTGWGVACQRLGILERGVEIMPEAVASRDAAGMHTAYHDVWDGLADPAIIPDHDLLIASPPCQTFSVAGKGSGRKALDDVLSLIQTGAWAQKGTALRDAASAAGLDDRTALVLSPLAYVAHSGPAHVVLEQVPAVLPVWEAVATEMRALGYSVVTGVLNAEQYGVPQTRRRAILIARRDGIAAAMPTPTHSRYYARYPERLDPGVRPWVSMADALGWPRDSTVRSAQSVAGVGRAERLGNAPGFAVTQTTSRVMRSNYGTGGDPAARGERTEDQPSATVTSKVDRNKWVSTEGEGGSTRVTIAEAAVLQSYPADFPFQGNRGKRFLQIGNAVPPLLGQAVITAALAGSVQTPEEVAA